MSDSTNIDQKAGFGAQGNTFIGEQHNHSGLTPADATQMAFAIFREYYPQLRQEALAEVQTIVEEELKKIPASDITAPSAKIAVPLLQNASITEEANLREMYAKLLVGDMNKKSKPSVHPAYIEILNQMSSDDAKIFRRIIEINNNIPAANVTFNLETTYLTNAMPHYFSPYFSDTDPWKTSICIENLSRLNLINIYDGTVNGYDYKKIKEDPFVTERFELSKKNFPTRNLLIKMTEHAISLNDFGHTLSELCF